jgi:hypothetical protein
MRNSRLVGLTTGLALVLVAVLLLPATAAAQSATGGGQQACGLQMPIVGGDQVVMQQPDDLGIHDQGMIDYSAVRGSIVHMDGPLALVKLEGVGQGNATSNQELAGNGSGLAVVKLPDECNLSDFSNGTPIMAIGTPTQQGILDAVEVTNS